MTDEEKEKHEPFLLSQDKREQKTKPPYLFIAIILFGVLGAFWKMAVRKDAPPKPIETVIHKKLSVKLLPDHNTSF